MKTISRKVLEWVDETENDARVYGNKKSQCKEQLGWFIEGALDGLVVVGAAVIISNIVTIMKLK